MGNEKGITLVALILIIVALVILAGISISLVVSNESTNVEITPSNQVVNTTRVEAEYDMTGYNDVNEVKASLNELENTNVVDAEVESETENTVATENVVDTANTVVEANTVEVENVVE